MKKLLVLALALSTTVATLRAQSTATSVSYNKISQPALMLELPYSEEVSQDFIVANLKKTGYDPETKGKLFWKQSKLDGYYIFKGVRLDGAGEALDLYFKVEPKSRRANNESVIYLLLGKADGTFVPTSSADPLYAAAKKFLDGFVDQAVAYKLDLDIKEQEDAVKKEQKKLEKLQDSQKDMQKKIEDLQSDLKKNKSDQEAQQKAVENAQEKLGLLKGQIKKG